MSSKHTYGYEQLADRIEQVLGDRPSLSALRAASAKERSTQATLSRPRLTVGMPVPLPSASRTALATFSAVAVEEWLRHHPRLGWNRAISDARARLAAGVTVEEVISVGLSRGLSWRTLTTLLNEHDGRSRSVSAVHKRYRHLGGQRA